MITIYLSEYVPTKIDITKAGAVIDKDMIFLSAKVNFRQFLGIHDAHQCLYNILSKEDGNKLKEAMKNIDKEDYVTSIAKMRRVDGENRDVSIMVSKIPDSQNYYLEIIDLKNVHNYLEELEIKSAEYANILQEFGKMFFEYDAQSEVLTVYNLRYDIKEILVQCTLEELQEDKYTAQMSEKDKMVLYAFCDSLKINDKFYNYVFEKNPFNDDEDSIFINGGMLALNENKILSVGYIKNIDPFTDSFDFNTARISDLDMMTGLLNKKAILKEARDSVENKKYEQIFFVMIDLDNFKMVNDNYGHMFGDEVIKKISGILKTVVGNKGYVGRFGGDEFFAVLYNLGQEGDLRSVLGSILTNVENSYRDKLEGFNLSVSMGISEYPRNGTDYDILFKKADRGVYIAKKKGKKRYIIYKEALHGELTADNADELEKLDIQKFAGDIKCYEIARDGISKLISEGESYLDTFALELINAYCLTGISVYAGKDFEIIKQWGDYEKPMYSAPYMKEKVALMRFNQKNIFCENNVMSNGFFVPQIHNRLLEYNIHSTVQCMIGTKEDVKGVVTFDIEKMLHNWTEEDANYFGIISNAIGN
ncbi:MAG: GGDEF domain-containing protein, partial [Firmicutes bacterium]|nr:GGDEF domain-containing protein [Bacillota bacterium]